MDKVWRKGVPFDPVVAPLAGRMAWVDEYRETLLRLHGTWDTLALLGQMSGTMAEIAETREQFQALSHVLLDSLARQQLRDATQALHGQARVAIDVLVRNLFERTADVGFLATDPAVRAMAADPGGADRAALEARFAAYVAKYSVYDDVVVLGLDGQVIARLDPAALGTACTEPWLAEALRPGVPHVERFGPSSLLDGRRGLLYAAAVMGPGGRAAGVLCLSFRFDDEMARLFDRLASGDGAAVVALLDGHGRVVASADPWQVPVGVRVPRCPPGQASVRLAGRDCLVARVPASGFQGYAGPGWEGLAVLPVEVAFGDTASPDLPAHAALARTLDTRDIFDDELRGIPLQADAIQRALARSVWNGRLQLGRQAGGASTHGLAAALLKEVTATADRIRDVFQQAVSRLHTAALSAVLVHARFQASLAIDIVDRNLYERANDCRWWALSGDLQQALADPAAAGRAGEVLARINGLYTVYSLLVLFDAQGRVVAVSDPARAALVGQALDADLVRHTLALRDPQAYHVTPHGPCALSGDVPTLVYSAAMAGGGVAVVFDGATQFAAMLQDAMPAVAGSSGLLLTREGRVVASTDPRFPVGTQARLPASLLQPGRGEAVHDLVEIDGTWYAAGAGHSGGYREYRSDGGRAADDLLAVMLMRLGARHGGEAAAIGRFVPKAVAAPAGAAHAELATFVVDGAWYALPAEAVVEALTARHVTPLPNARAPWRGLVNWRDHPLPVADLPGRTAGAAADLPLLVCVAAPGRHVALRVDALGDVLTVPASALQPWTSPVSGAALQLLSGTLGDAPALLTVLQAAAVFGVDAPQAAGLAVPTEAATVAVLAPS